MKWKKNKNMKSYHGPRPRLSMTTWNSDSGIVIWKMQDHGLSKALSNDHNKENEMASDIGNKALAALPRPESLKPGTIENLRALGLTKLATSLEGVGKGLQSGEMVAGFLKGLPNSTFDDKRTVASVPNAPAPARSQYNPSYLSGYTGYRNTGYGITAYPYFG